MIDFEFELLRKDDDLDFSVADSDTPLTWTLPLRVHARPAVARKVVSTFRFDHAPGSRYNSGFGVFSPASCASSALSCLEPVSVKVATATTATR
jgi:hypothetical protein